MLHSSLCSADAVQSRPQWRHTGSWCTSHWVKGCRIQQAEPGPLQCWNSPNKAMCWYRWRWIPIPTSPELEQHLVMLKLYSQTLTCCTAALLSRPLWTRGPPVTNCLLGVHRTGTAQTFLVIEDIPRIGATLRGRKSEVSCILQLTGEW